MTTKIAKKMLPASICYGHLVDGDDHDSTWSGEPRYIGLTQTKIHFPVSISSDEGSWDTRLKLYSNFASSWPLFCLANITPSRSQNEIVPTSIGHCVSMAGAFAKDSIHPTDLLWWNTIMVQKAVVQLGLYCFRFACLFMNPSGILFLGLERLPIIGFGPHTESEHRWYIIHLSCM